MESIRHSLVPTFEIKCINIMKIRVLTYLVATVWKIIKDTCDLIGMNVPTINELENMLDKETWDVYEKGLTCVVNQADSNFATPLVMKYKPKTVAELCAFIASIRPGFASLLDNFIERKPYSTGVEELDELLKESYHYMMYQESIMKYLVWLGIPEDETYGIIKKISKKNFTQEEINNLKETLFNNWVLHVGTDKGFSSTWEVIENAVRYAFNSAHSLSYSYDSLYIAYLKSHYPLEFYTVVLNKYEGDTKRTPRLIDECKYFQITINPPKFGYSKSDYFLDKENQAIYKGIGSVKFLNKENADFLYGLSQQKEYDTFTDILIDARKVGFRTIEILIRLGYFSKFGSINKLLKILELYKLKGDKKTLHKTKDVELYIPYKNLAEKNSFKETSQTLIIDYPSFIRDIEKILDDTKDDIIQKIKDEIKYTGGFIATPYKTFDKKACLVTSLNVYRYNVTAALFCMYSGNVRTFKINKKIYDTSPFSEMDVIYLYSFKSKIKKDSDERSFWITDYDVI